MWPQSKVCLPILALNPHSWENPSSPMIWKCTWKAMMPKSDFLVLASSWVPVHLSDTWVPQAQPVSLLHFLSTHTHTHTHTHAYKPMCALCILSCFTSCSISVKYISSYSVAKCRVWIIFYSFFFFGPSMNTDSKTLSSFTRQGISFLTFWSNATFYGNLPWCSRQVRSLVIASCVTPYFYIPQCVLI